MTRTSKEVGVTQYEEERLRRIEENQKRMQELGIHQTVAAIEQAVATREAKPTQPRKRKQHYVEVTCRRSNRIQGNTPESYAEDSLFRKFGIDRLDMIDAPTRRRRINMDPEHIKSIRQGRKKELEGDDVSVSRESGRVSFDSGLGVRIQGGRVYDSKYGVTCHWCRQKTLEEHVECTDADCGGGRKLPVAFCKMCLMNRHGEDIHQAISSGKWVCPACRGNCGAGCTLCCNCGPCRKKAGLAPTHQLIKEARSSGFSNVHDYLVHRSTRETEEEIAARKEKHPWGAWLSVPYTPAQNEADTPGPSTVSNSQQQRAVEEATISNASQETVTVTRQQGLNDGAEEMDSATKAPKLMKSPNSGGSAAKKSSTRKQRMLHKLGLVA